MALDVLSTHYALEKNACVYEANPLYSSTPSLGELVLGKLIVVPLVPQNEREIKWLNQIYTGLVFNNLRVAHSTCS